MVSKRYFTILSGNNTANGVAALFGNTTGSINTAIGVSALLNNTTGFLNTALGAGVGGNILTANNVICIGASGADVSNTTWIDHIYNTAPLVPPRYQLSFLTVDSSALPPPRPGSRRRLNRWTQLVKPS